MYIFWIGVGDRSSSGVGTSPNPALPPMIQHRPSIGRWTLALLLSPLLVLLCACDPRQLPESSEILAKQGLHSAAIDPTAERILIGSIQHGASLWQHQPATRKFNWNHHNETFSMVIAADFSADARRALTATPRTLALWDVDSGHNISHWAAPSEILAARLLPDGRQVLLGLADHSALLFDSEHGKIQRQFTLRERVISLDSSASGDLLISGTEGHNAQLWQRDNGQQLQSWPHRGAVQLVRLSPDGTVAFTVAKYDGAKFWDSLSGELRSEIPLGSAAVARGLAFTAATFSADGKQLLTGSSNRTVQLWQVEPLKKIKRWRIARRTGLAPRAATVLTLAFDTQGSYHAITADGMVHLLR